MTYIVGKRYEVMALELGKPFPKGNGNDVTIAEWHGFTGLLPLLNWFSEDEHFIAGHQPHLHAHIDWRFLRKHAFQQIRETMVRMGFRAHGAEITLHVIQIDREWMKYLRPTFTTMRCRRELPMPDFEVAHWRESLDAKYPCAALANGRCPHRGVPASAMVEVDGMLVCPAHGLRFPRAAA